MKYIYKFFLVIFILIISTLVYLSSAVSIWNYKFYVISSGSMSPSLRVGDLIVSSGSATSSFNAGDIVTFKSPVDQESYITHRILKKDVEDEILFTTKGDNNSVEDPWQLTTDMIIGKLSYSVPYIGFPILFLRSSKIYLTVIAGFLLLISFIEINTLSSEFVYIWKNKNRYKSFRYLLRMSNRVDKFLGNFNQNKTENAGL